MAALTQEQINKAIDEYSCSLIKQGYVPGRRYWGTIYLQRMQGLIVAIYEAQATTQGD